MIVNCPECGKKISDKATMCIGCGFPLRDLFKKDLKMYTVCPDCGMQNEVGVYCCKKCGHSYTVAEYEVVDARDNFCPLCKSNRIRSFVEEQVISPGKKKTYTSINLNPFKPFTLFNEKEKVIKKPIIYKKTKFICDNCGNIWQ